LLPNAITIKNITAQSNNIGAWSIKLFTVVIIVVVRSTKVAGTG
jgi:hypothetical protein